MNNRYRVIVIFLLVAAMQFPAAGGVKGSPHDLSALASGDACSFCHTPHGALPKSPGWSRKISTAVYKIYQSSSLEAKVGQPTGSSKMCLSCHDGTVALTHTRKGNTSGVYITPGQANLGTDLSDDHPISFVYSDSLSAKDSQIRLASTLPEEFKLDRSGELQCTTCHTSHDNQYGDFLVVSNRRSQMCTSCHDLDGWTGSEHESSTSSVVSAHDAYLRKSKYQTVADNGCLSCHRPHSAGGNERLLHFENSEENCLICHDGSVAGTNIKAQISKSSGHDVTAYRDVHDLRESPVTSARHVECVDCHNAHAVQPIASQAPLAPGAMQKVTGVTTAGLVTQHAQYEYEVCFKCHGDNPNRIESNITRQITQTNTRLEFEPSGPSFHPVVSIGVNKDVPSLRSSMSVASIIYCTDCHNSNDSSDARGPHGSDYSPLLVRNYETSDYTSESESAYGLCYGCHSRNSILGDESFPQHRKHLEDKIPCSACHDAHGISSAQGSSTNNSHLINFDTAIVSADPQTDRLEFVDMGVFSGECFLTCHGESHSPKGY
ncbi:MAG: cytochrome c3 family protein [Planctomycetota bacterium]